MNGCSVQRNHINGDVGALVTFTGICRGDENGKPIAALTLDEFALWLNLQADAYWTKEGRSSIDAVILFGSLLMIGAWGAPLFSGKPSNKS